MESNINHTKISGCEHLCSSKYVRIIIHEYHINHSISRFPNCDSNGRAVLRSCFSDGHIFHRLTWRPEPGCRPVCRLPFSALWNASRWAGRVRNSTAKFTCMGNLILQTALPAVQTSVLCRQSCEMMLPVAAEACDICK